MKLHRSIEKITNHLKQHKSLWMEHEYTEHGKTYKVEFFIKFHNKVFYVGLDEYLEDYEDATDLYKLHIRESYNSLSEAMPFITDELHVKEKDILAKLEKRR